MARGQRQQQPDDIRTLQLRDFTGGVNQTDSRVAIKNNEVAWAENCLPIGAGSIQILNGPGPSIAAFANGCVKLEGRTLNGSPVALSGSLNVTPAATTVYTLVASRPAR